MRHELLMEMIHSNPQTGTLTGTCQALADLKYRPDIEMNPLDHHIIIFQNGVLDLATGHLSAHDPRHYTTKILPYDYSPTATAPTWTRFLDDILEGDSERIGLLQEWLGYMMSPTYQYQKIMLFLGVRRGGKSIIGDIMRELVGDLNYTATSLNSFADDDALDSMRGKTVAFSGDTARNVNRNKIDVVIERVKKVSGGDAVDFKRKFKSRMSCKLPTRITLSSNHIPRLFDDSGALGHRIMVIPFDVSYADREDPYLLGRLKTEMGGISMWALEGLGRLNARGKFLTPARSLEEMDFIKEAYGSLEQFIEKYCVLGGVEITPVFDAYETFRVWCMEQQESSIMGRNSFISALKETTRGKGCRYGVHRTPKGIQRGFKGLRLLPVDTPYAVAFKPEVVK